MRFATRVKLAISAVVFVVLGCANFVSGSMVLTFAETATASGSLNGASFSNANLTVSTTVDTSTVTYINGDMYVTPVGNLTTYSIAGIGSGSFTDSIRVEDLPGMPASFSDVGFDDLTVSRDIFGIISSAFYTYTLQSVLAPTTGTLIFSPSTYGTSGGPLILTSVTNPSFSATAVPEPASAGLIGLSSLCLRRARRQIVTPR